MHAYYACIHTYTYVDLFFGHRTIGLGGLSFVVVFYRAIMIEEKGKAVKKRSLHREGA